MSASEKDRPDLSRRRPRPAPDERVDPVDYRGTTAPTPELPAAAEQQIETQAPAPQPTPAKRANTQTTQRTTRVGRPRRDPTINFSTRLSPEIIELIDKAVARGEGDGIIRNVIEEAIRSRWGN